MTDLVDRFRRRDAVSPPVGRRPLTEALAADPSYELIPMRSFDDAVSALPAGARVSVTCSPTGGIGETQLRTERLVAEGFRVTPHLAARLVTGAGHAAELAAWVRSLGLDEVFVIAGDAPERAGSYVGALGFLEDFVALDPGVSRIGVAGYPDGHALISPDEAARQLRAKQELIDRAGLGGWVSTQMCFDPDRIVGWLRSERVAGLTLPVRLGVPGAVERTRLLRVAMRLGVGASMRYLSKNTSVVSRLVAPGGYDPTGLVDRVAVDAEQLAIESLHVFTFNAVADTVAWQRGLTARS